MPLVGIYPHSGFFVSTHNKLVTDEFWPRKVDASDGGRAKPVMIHPSVVRLDVGPGELVDQASYLGSSMATPPPALKQKRAMARALDWSTV